MIKYCMIKNCRFPISHTSMGHLCGSCHDTGHGIVECNNKYAINYIKQHYHRDILPLEMHCQFGSCNSQYHTSAGHFCLLCFDRLHSAETCPSNNPVLDIKLDCPICRCENIIRKDQPIIKGYNEQCAICMENQIEIFFPNCGHTCICLKCMKRLDKNTKYKNNNELDIFDDIRDESVLIMQGYDITLIRSTLLDYPSYISIDEGMGCCTLIRKLNSNSPIEGLFNHSDDGYSTEKMEKLKKFVTGYCYIECDPIMTHEWKGY
jgi:hypothetical protein